jgi:hypothetical protein
VFRGGVPPGQYGVMRAPFQEGEFPGLVKYGYLNVGVVEQGGPGRAGCPLAGWLREGRVRKIAFVTEKTEAPSPHDTAASRHR